MPTAANRFESPIRMRKVPATREPTKPRVCNSGEPSSCTGPTMARTPIASRNASPNTTLEWPSENQKPADSDRVPCPDQLAGGVVDHGDVVGVERVPDSEQVGRHTQSDAEDTRRSQRDVLRRHPEHQHAPPEDVERQNDAAHRRDRRPIGPVESVGNSGFGLRGDTHRFRLWARARSSV